METEREKKIVEAYNEAKMRLKDTYVKTFCAAIERDKILRDFFDEVKKILETERKT